MKYKSCLPFISHSGKTLRFILAGGVGLSSYIFSSEIQVRPIPGQDVIGQAISKAAAGDLIKLLPGTYREHVILNKAVTLDGSSGAILDPSQDLEVRWESADEIGPGVWKFRASKKPESLFLNGKVVAEITKKRALAEGPWHWKTLLSAGLPQSGFAMMKALWMWSSNEQVAYAKIESGQMNGQRWSVIMDDRATIDLANVKGANVISLTIASATVGVRFGKKVEGCVLRNCRILAYESEGVLVTDEAKTCLINSNFITRGAVESYASTCNDVDQNKKPEYEIWKLHKNYGKYDSTGVNLHRAGVSNQVLSNDLRLNFDGIDIGDYAVQFSLTNSLQYPEQCLGTEVAWNRIEDTRDSGMELGAGAIDIRIHHNYFLRTHGGLRFKIPRIGPVFVYQNLFEDDRRMNIWFSMDSSPAAGYIYQNTIIGRNTALSYWGFGTEPVKPVAENWHLINNLFITTNGYFSSLSKNYPTPDFISSHNLVVTMSNGWLGVPDKDSGSVYLTDLPRDASGRPEPGYPGLRVGMDLHNYLNGKPLPGCELEGAKSGQNKVGAYENPF